MTPGNEMGDEGALLPPGKGDRAMQARAHFLCAA